ncbi:unnamed protein product [Scytosiphon promiscuus]
MAPMKSACFAIGLVASAAGKVVVPGSAVYNLQGGASGLETDGDYIENKIARGVYGSTEQVAKGVQSVFGVAADEAKHAQRMATSAARSTRDSARETARNVKGAARDAASSARGSVHMPNKVGWPFEKEEIVDDRHAVTKFFQNPNNAFVAQAVTAAVFGGLHIAKYVEFINQFTSPVSRALGLDYAAGAFGPHVRVVGAFLVGMLVSDVFAYKSISAGFKRGKIWHEMVSCISIAAVCLGELFTDKPADMIPHAIAAAVFAGWYTYLSQEY